jgi:hypothetical protein
MALPPLTYSARKTRRQELVARKRPTPIFPSVESYNWNESGRCQGTHHGRNINGETRQREPGAEPELQAPTPSFPGSLPRQNEERE